MGDSDLRIIVCLDDGGGMCFNKRRQSRDRALLKDLKAYVDEDRLLCSTFSEKMLTEAGIAHEVSERFLELAGEDDFCFVECDGIAERADAVKEIVIYKWKNQNSYH